MGKTDANPSGPRTVTNISSSSKRFDEVYIFNPPHFPLGINIVWKLLMKLNWNTVWLEFEIAPLLDK